MPTFRRDAITGQPPYGIVLEPSGQYLQPISLADDVLRSFGTHRWVDGPIFPFSSFGVAIQFKQLMVAQFRYNILTLSVRSRTAGPAEAETTIDD